MARLADIGGAAARGGAVALGVLAVLTLRYVPPGESGALAIGRMDDDALSRPRAPGERDLSTELTSTAPRTEPAEGRVRMTSTLPVNRDDRSEAGTGSGWALRTGGWFIRVDGAVVPLPSLSAQTAARPRAGLAVTISPYDQLIWYHANAEGFDWRLVAALIFEESGFNPTARSDKGAYGLMQVRPVAAEAVGAARFDTPDDNIRTGVRYLRQLDEMFQPVRGVDRLAFVLAAYNMGPGHVRDAQILASRFGYDPYRWDEAVALMLPLLEEPAVYETVPLGYARGNDTVAYVARVLDRFRDYRRTTPLATDAGAPAPTGAARTG